LPITKHLFALGAKFGVLLPINKLNDYMVKLITQRKNEMNKTSTDQQDFIDIFIKAEANDDDLKKIVAERSARLDRNNTKIEKKMTIDVSFFIIN
jgi:hypothetical protein